MQPTEVDSVSLGELSRNFKSLQQSIGTGFERLEKKIDDRPSWQSIERMEKVHEATHKALETDVKELQDSNRWITRTVFAALLTGLVSIAVAVFLSAFR
jgi:hypothetical protein